MGPLNSKTSFLIIIKSTVAALATGATLAGFNMLLELLKGNSSFGFFQFYMIAMWYMVLWLPVGLFFGSLFALLSLGKEKINFHRFNFHLLFHTFIGVWITLTGYFNLFVWPDTFKPSSIILNLGLLFLGLIGIFFILKKIDYSKTRPFPLFFRLYLLALILIIGGSFFVYSGIFSRDSRPQAQDERGQNNHFNILLISLDATRADHFGCYGYGRNTTPNIDRLAASGVIFENAFSHSSLTAESVPSLLTSTYPSTHNVRYEWDAIPEDIFRFPSLFKSEGYRTAIFSALTPVSSTLGYRRDIDEFYEPYSIILNRTILYMFATRIPGLKQIIRPPLDNFSNLFRNRYTLESHHADYYIPKAISWLEDNKNHPFFLYLHLFGGHAHYSPPPEYTRLFDPDYTAKPITKPPERMNINFPFGKQPPMPDRELFNMIAQYDGQIYFHDKYLGDLFEYMKTSGLSENTLIIITADHGEEFYEHSGWEHMFSVFDEVIHVPLIFYSPKLIPAGLRISELIAHVDVFPTAVSLCDIYDLSKFPFKIEGKDLSSLILEKGSHVRREYIFSEIRTNPSLAAECLRTDKFKAMCVYSGKEKANLFFDLIADPGEQNNIYNPEIPFIMDYFNQLNMIRERAEERAFTKNRIILDERTKEQLKALGYIK